MHKQELDPCNIMTRMFKYSFLGIAAVVALHMIPKNKLMINDTLMIAATIVLVYFFLETPMFKKETYNYHKLYIMNESFKKAISEGNLQKVKELVEQGVDIHVDENWALRCAALYEHLDVVKLLIENGANVHAEDDYALRWSAQNSSFKIVKFLVENGANVHAENDKALRWSALNGSFKTVKFLIENGANVHTLDDYTLTMSAEKGYFEIVKLLLENGANVHAKDNEALRLSAEKGYYDLVELLIENGANINNAIAHCERSYTRNILKRYIKKEMYKGQLNDHTETDCGICLTEMNTLEQEIVQCETCKKCVHNECYSKWKTVNNSCVYCRN